MRSAAAEAWGPGTELRERGAISRARPLPWCPEASPFPRSAAMKVVNLKQAILQAWKERWSDYQWAINMKRFFPRGATWDILNLAGPGGGGGRSLRGVPWWCASVAPKGTISPTGVCGPGVGPPPSWMRTARGGGAAPGPQGCFLLPFMSVSFPGPIQGRLSPARPGAVPAVLGGLKICQPLCQL